MKFEQSLYHKNSEFEKKSKKKGKGIKNFNNAKNKHKLRESSNAINNRNNHLNSMEHQSTVCCGKSKNKNIEPVKKIIVQKENESMD